MVLENEMNKQFNFDYRKYETGLDKTTLKIMISEIWTPGISIFKMILLAIKISITISIFWMIYKKTDTEKEAEKQRWINKIEDDSQSNVDI